MSSLMFFADEKQVITATDTLATSPDGTPAFFTTKAFAVPHLKMLMAGTGVAGFLGRWFVEVNDRMVVRGIDNLDFHPPRILATCWSKFREENSIPDDLTTTVYHLGFSEETGLTHIHVYRSTKDFVSETLPYGIVVKPECHPPENPVFPNDFKKMMEEQRTIQEALPKSERVFIGGNIQIHHLTKDGVCIYTLDRFKESDAMLKEIFDNYEAKNRNT